MDRAALRESSSSRREHLGALNGARGLALFDTGGGARLVGRVAHDGSVRFGSARAPSPVTVLVFECVRCDLGSEGRAAVPSFPSRRAVSVSLAQIAHEVKNGLTSCIVFGVPRTSRRFARSRRGLASTHINSRITLQTAAGSSMSGPRSALYVRRHATPQRHGTARPRGTGQATCSAPPAALALAKRQPSPPTQWRCPRRRCPRRQK